MYGSDSFSDFQWELFNKEIYGSGGSILGCSSAMNFIQWMHAWSWCGGLNDGHSMSVF